MAAWSKVNAKDVSDILHRILMKLGKPTDQNKVSLSALLQTIPRPKSFRPSLPPIGDIES